jgi:serine/threonine protein phosphatase PrpC
MSVFADAVPSFTSNTPLAVAGLLNASKEQDYALHITLEKDEHKIDIAIVCDGHGEVSIARQTCIILLDNIKLYATEGTLLADPSEARAAKFQEFVDMAHMNATQLIEKSGSMSGGTTMACAIKITYPHVMEKEPLLLTFNLGDTRIAVIKESGDCVYLDVMHSPDEVSEALRIMLDDSIPPYMKGRCVYDQPKLKRRLGSMGTAIYQRDGTKTPLKKRQYTNPDGTLTEPMDYLEGMHLSCVDGNVAVYFAYSLDGGFDTVCIGLTRALGDLEAHNHGLCHNILDTYKETSLGKDYILIALFSDGCGDVNKSSDVGRTLLGYGGDLTNMVSCFMIDSRQKWFDLMGADASQVDDISCVLMGV